MQLFDVCGSRVSSPMWSPTVGDQGVQQVAGSGALQLFDEVQQQRLEPNAITYAAVISANGRTLQLLERCCSRDSCPIDHLHRSDQSQLSDLAAV